MHGFALLMHAVIADRQGEAREETRRQQARDASEASARHRAQSASRRADESVVDRRQAQAQAATHFHIRDAWLPRLHGYPIDPSYARR